MTCYQCGNEYIEHEGPFEWIDGMLGKIAIPRLKYQKCDTCGDLLFSPESARAIEAARDKAAK